MKTAAVLIKELKKHQSDVELEKIKRYFKEESKFIGIRMGTIFKIASQNGDMDIKEIEKLLDSPIHEFRVAGISIMDKQSRKKNTTEERRKEFFDLIIRRTDRINNWDLVDLAALHVTGCYLYDKPRAILYKLAKSKDTWERRIAIVSTAYFIRKGDVADTFRIAEMLVKDKNDLVHKATGWMLRFAGAKDKKRLLAFLDKYAATMPRVLLRYSIENLGKKEKEHYMNVG
ncbi:MAG TPA: DNA alkylation repair protein [Cyclobacteriaceae bacterium]|nr:DNA alkylation repair protein [Cyclobacteriaceae bacterium]